MKKKIFAIFILIAIAANAQTFNLSVFDTNYYHKYKGQNLSVNVYNWGEYISDGSDGSLDVNKLFEELTGVKVNYSTFASNEEMYVKLKVGGIQYDVIIPSDYMIERLIRENLVRKLNYNNIPAHTNIANRFKNLPFDPTGEYSLAYTWGVTGIIYNKTLVSENADEIDWKILFDKKYQGKILMYYNPRDAFGIAQAYLGYSLNTTNESELRECAKLLKTQKPLVQSYVMDEMYDKMEAGEAAIGVYYAGDSLTMIDNNPDLNFVIPKKGANLFVDSICIPASSGAPELGEMYINFLSEPEIALANIEFINYASPNDGAIAIMSTETKNNKIIYPDQETLDNCEVYITLPDETNILMEDLWNEILSNDTTYKGWVIPVALGVIVLLCVVIIVLKKMKRREN
ncbi:spermidine/putrescine ABC transporter substrate-binding protein [Brachyspira hyodysenteriae]|uniref:ABC transporter substrate-binding protein n=1 Tax=Brachyspira hyodysenteriae TaxID=159 RepID=UPI00063DC74A|nr:ABC transporter substrate-binding protein [Brachyspira hyodysenteriae]KLI34628.1 spermidine/putrescine ABC transporter substrate-binding protein [Brachyspira hyodysenteriae]KLI39962.1 spermidine/putrescine ABC transporter substrate-binding protein [Brachyspira hyodysenteriae]KLI47002.1 spermidine/putrescine ABC transporter substrate-binding protein [Brachyspira hyodysenteriae]MCZ9956903.1 ABC transporter substrate-binding protein [Brachyspira hyodysenteriae]MCZ9962332.1 ABC transporter subs